ncbi:MAG: methyltransferase domain-containing protein [Alphaproteobacteria bacterium]|nr:MAG: methyltransferase domain-containing protein [Alphaproteobacteria bacterium]
MHADVIEWGAFYASPTGRASRMLLARAIARLWPDVPAPGQRMMGLGYALPYLDSWRAGPAERVLAFMPAGQGVTAWPQGSMGNRGNAACLVDENQLPLADASVDRILAIHALEGAAQPQAMLQECWRVLSGQGSLLLVVTNRHGLWARAEQLPFGHGSPYSLHQAMHALQDALLIPRQTCHALHAPPALIASSFWEELGARVIPALAGMILIEASKQTWVPARRVGLPARQRLPLVPATLPHSCSGRDGAA